MNFIEGFIQPKKIEFRSFLESVDGRSVSELKKSLSDLVAYSSEEIQWLNYFQALLKIKEEADVDALNILKKIYESSKVNLTDEQADSYRFLGLVLKKIGWIYRKNKDFEKAYFYHSARHLYLSRYGSAAEIHDAAISLDMDAYYLKDLKVSEFWLLNSKDAAMKINNPIDRSRSLGLTNNNLGSTYALQKRFNEAVACIYAALDAWIDYEALTGPHENKVVWAYYAVGDVYESWLLHRQETKDNTLDQKTEALRAFRKAIALAEQRNMPETDRLSMQDRLNKILDTEPELQV